MNVIREFLDATTMKSSTDKSIERKIEQPIEGGIQLKEYFPSREWKDFFSSRRTVRQFADTALTMEELSYLLWAIQGITGESDRGILRNSPSAGATHALDTYLMVNHVEGLEKGVYKFSAVDFKLELVMAGEEVNEKIITACKKQRSVAESAVTFIWACDIARSYWRFGARAYRYALIDSGHICDHLYMAANTIGCGVCAIGAYDDDQINEIFGMDGEQRFVTYGAALGKK